MKIVIYSIDFKMPFSVLCSLVTGYSQSHAAVIQDGKLYDTTFTKGKFTEDSNVKMGDRIVTVYDLPDVDGSKWIKENINVKYDKLGLLLWPLHIEKDDQYYCFQIVEEILREQGIEINPQRKPIQAKHITNFLHSVGCKGVTGRAKDLLP